MFLEDSDKSSAFPSSLTFAHP